MASRQADVVCINLISSDEEEKEQKPDSDFHLKVESVTHDLKLLASPQKKKQKCSSGVHSKLHYTMYGDISDDDEDEDAKDENPDCKRQLIQFKECPVYMEGKTDYTFQETIQILTSEHSPDILCEKQPMNCQRNMAFLIDSTKVKIRDLPCDDNGSYLATGSHTLTYKKVGDHHSEVEFISKKRELPEHQGERYLYLRRIYRTNKACKDFKQIVSYLEDSQGNIINNAVLLQYNFKGKEHSFEAKPHGNSKNKAASFLPTNKSKKDEIKEVAKQMKPKKALITLTKGQDLLTATSSANTTRDRKQIYNMRSSGNKSDCKDELYAIMLQAAAEEDEAEEAFIHSIPSWPEPMCILGFKYQFHDIVRFCCDPERSVPLSADTTFNIGKFYVTPTSYRNLHLESTRTGTAPVFLGPILVHMTRSYAAYSHLLAKLKELEPDIDDMKCCMTDGEPGLIKAINTFLRNTVSLRCLIHFRNNVKDELKKLDITGERQNYFLNRVFGSTSSGIHVEGLIDAKSDKEFDSLLLAYKREMNEKESELPKSDPKFHSWIQSHAEMMKSSIILGARLKAGLQAGDSATTNDAESNNHVLKSAADNEEMSTVEFISLAKSLAVSQKQEVIRAVIRKGDYRFTHDFQDLEYSETQWMHHMSTETKRRHLMKVLSVPVLADPATRKHHPKGISIPFSAVNLHQPSTLLTAIWAKAEDYINTAGRISQMPEDMGGSGNKPSFKAFAVHSKSNPHCPNIVKLYVNCAMECSCYMFKSTKTICAHTVATAEKEGVLGVYLQWVESAVSQYNLYELATKNINIRASGRKGGKPKQTRKTCHKEPVCCTVSNRDQLASAGEQRNAQQPFHRWILPTGHTTMSSSAFPQNSTSALPLFQASLSTGSA